MHDNLPGLRASATSDANGDPTVEKIKPAKVDPAQSADPGYGVVYPGVSTVRLDIKPTKTSKLIWAA